MLGWFGYNVWTCLHGVRTRHQDYNVCIVFKCEDNISGTDGVNVKSVTYDNPNYVWYVHRKYITVTYNTQFESMSKRGGRGANK